MAEYDDPALPNHSAWLVRWFQKYCRRYAAKHFHAIRLSKRSHPLPSATDTPIIIVMNHPAWWDVITAFILTSQLPEHRHYAPIDQEMFEKYRFFRKLGLFGVEPTARGAAKFIRTAKAIFSQSNNVLWITAQGRFSDPRERPLNLRPGVGAVATRLEKGLIVPVAVEYPFWEERTPELLVQIGEPIHIEAIQRDAREWTCYVEQKLCQVMDELAIDSISRDPQRFTPLIVGKVGVGGVYDWWRRFRNIISGKKSSLGHGKPEF